VLLGGCVAMISQAYWSTVVAQTVGYTWIALLYATFLLYLLTQDSELLRKVFRSKPLTFLGTIAYGVNLFHQPIILWVASLLSPTMPLRNGFPMIDSLRSFAMTCAALVLTLVLAQISWKRFEKPLVEIGHRSKY
jgi:peptidoglycan/LPS O-acetylase OafA/YrhL